MRLKKECEFYCLNDLKNDIEKKLKDEQNVTLLPDGRKIVAGKTNPGETGWETYRSLDLVLKVDLRPYGFKETPCVVTSLHGHDCHWTTTGGSQPYDVSKDEFTIYVKCGEKPSEANQKMWHLHWIAIGF